MKTKTGPDIDLHDEPEGEDVSKVFIGGCSEGPVPLMEWTSKEIVLLETDDFPVQSPVHVIVAGINPSDPDSIDIPEDNVPNTDNTPVEPESTDISEVDVPNTENIPIEPETSILQPLTLSTTTIDVLAGTQVPTIDIIFNSAGIMSIQEYIHRKGRIEMYFSITNCGYFLFACLIAPQLIKPARHTPNEPMLVKNDRRPFCKRSTIVWADLRYGILGKEEDAWSPIRRFGIFKKMSRRIPDEELILSDCVTELQRAWNWYFFIASFMFVLPRAIIYMLDLLVFVCLSVLVVAGVTRFIPLVQEFYRDINWEALIRESSGEV
ncbi:hypothetical protein V501_10418 [Pseudogymnoascus sp. VKM F-4519 (FW-2642)]|nr:hypothetical protein V501_10418 [Pseudogymnoascus sp. VKM F-4519 (FW-2642)]